MSKNAKQAPAATPAPATAKGKGKQAATPAATTAPAKPAKPKAEPKYKGVTMGLNVRDTFRAVLLQNETDKQTDQQLFDFLSAELPNSAAWKQGLSVIGKIRSWYNGTHCGEGKPAPTPSHAYDANGAVVGGPRKGKGKGKDATAPAAKGKGAAKAPEAPAPAAKGKGKPAPAPAPAPAKGKGKGK